MHILRQSQSARGSAHAAGVRRPPGASRTGHGAMTVVRTPKNFDAALIELRCPSRHCTYRFRRNGEQYKTAGALTCPECGSQVEVDLALLKRLHENQLKLLRHAKARLRSLGI